MPDSVDAAQLIQIALTPVFLLSSIGVILGVLTNRLVRIIDRARKLEDRATSVSEAQQQADDEVIRVLGKRARYTYTAITLATIAAVAVSFVVVLLFVDAFLVAEVSRLIAVLFVLAILSLAAGLLIFLVEVRIATASLRIGR